MPQLRRQGVWPQNLPTKKAKAVTPADFAIAGLIGLFDRHFKQVFVAQGPQDVSDVVGDQGVSAYFGWDAVNGFFANTKGQSAKLYFLSHVNTIGAVQASQTINNSDGSPAPKLTFSDGYNALGQNGVISGVAGYGASGNRTGITIVNGFRAATKVGQTGNANDAFFYSDSPGAFRVGDTIQLNTSGGGAQVIYMKVTAIDFGTSKVSISGTIGAGKTATLGDVVNILGIQIHTWRKKTDGSVTEVDKQLSALWCTMDPQVLDFYVGNVFSQSKFLVLQVLATTPTSPEKDFPANISAPQYPSNGADGTQNATLATEYAGDLLLFNSAPVRFMANCETTDSATQKAGEAYCNGRLDSPIWIPNLPEAQSKAQLLAIGAQWQRANEVDAVLWDKWMLVTDPFAKTSNAPPRHVPSVGHMMGYWIQIIGTKGTHWAAAQQDTPIMGAIDVSVPSTGDPTLDDQDRTDLLNAGVNVIQNRLGIGIVPRNSNTPSTTLEFMFGNAILQRNFVKNSCVESLQGSENTPNALNRIREDKMAVTAFYLRLWRGGSTGNSPEGEALGQQQNADGSSTKATDHFEVKVDIINNPQDQINLGNRNVDSWFTYVAPSGSIRIGVGFMLRQ